MEIDKFNRYLNFAQNTVYSEPETPAFHTPLIKLAIESFFDKLTQLFLKKNCTTL
jgi:hypothetical protein